MPASRKTTQARKLEAQVAKLETAVASAKTSASDKASKAGAKSAEEKMKKEIDQAEAKSKVMSTKIDSAVLAGGKEQFAGI